MRTRIAVVAGVAMALALPAATQAALPKITNTLIVPNKSIGGVALGGTVKSVTKAWGKNKQCETDCVYEGKNSGEQASAALESKGSGTPFKVGRIFIEVSQTTVGSTLKPNFNTPLTKFKTSKGIGLGSKAGEIKKAYHSAKKSSSAYVIEGPGESLTVFGLTSTGRVADISISSHPGG